MPRKSPQSSPIQEGLRLMSQCPVCHEQYRNRQKHILEKKEGAHLVHITCPHCKNAILAVVVVSQLGMSSVGMMTDLNVDDVLRLRNKGNIKEDDVLNFHQSLKEENFINLLKFNQ